MMITAIPDDDPTRALTLARPDTDKSLVHVAVVGDTYTILVTGKDTAGHYTLIDMHVPPSISIIERRACCAPYCADRQLVSVLYPGRPTLA
jgi:hypothetical protein